MKRINIFIAICLSLSMLMNLTACSSEDSMSEPQAVKTKNGFYIQKVNFICEAPGYDLSSTRAVTYDWNNKTTLFARFKSGSNYYLGYLIKNSDGWGIAATKDFLELSTSGTCELYYFLEPNGDYYYYNTDNAMYDVYNNASLVRHTDMPWDGTINLSEGTAIYATTTATYSREKGKGMTVQAMLNPMLWRMRFSGSNGTSITLPESDNDIKYVSSFKFDSSAKTTSFTKTAKDVTLKVSSGYTPYFYGEFVYPYAKNTITVVNGNNTFYREFASSNLPVGKSGYFTIPTTSNYSSNGWTMKQDIDQSATIQPDYLVTFTDGIVTNWKLGSTANTFAYTILSKSEAESLSDEELASRVFNEESYSATDIKDYLYQFVNSSFTPNTNYYLCAVAKNNSGKRGPVLRYLFKTNSTNLPYAEISNVKAVTTTKWQCDITLKNSATKYYIVLWTGENTYNEEWHFVAYWLRESINGGEKDTLDWSGVAWTLNSGTCKYATVCTWGVSSTGAIGNPHVAHGNVSSSARKRAENGDRGKLQKGAISRKDLEKMMGNTRLYKINK